MLLVSKFLKDHCFTCLDYITSKEKEDKDKLSKTWKQIYADFYWVWNLWI